MGKTVLMSFTMASSGMKFPPSTLTLTGGLF